MFDTVARRWVGPSRDPLIWYAGEKQADVLLDPMVEHTRILLYAAEGAGKSYLMSQWLILQALACSMQGMRGAFGATAPTGKRLTEFTKRFGECIPISSPHRRRKGAWAIHRLADGDIVFHFGITVNFRATKKHSNALSSPIQGYTWLRSADDELQDTADNGADPDIEARLRGCQTSRRMATATAKDSPMWRVFRDGKMASPDWGIRRLRFDDAPFIHPDHWARMRRNMSTREWERRGLALDVSPEFGVYPAWSHDENIRKEPRYSPHTPDITAQLPGMGTDAHGRQFGILIGHDPGEVADVSLFLRCYQVDGRRHYYVIDEITTTGTSEAHIMEVKSRLQNKWGCQGNAFDSPQARVICDPQGQTERRTDAAIYTLWHSAGFAIRSAQYTKSAKPQGRISKRVRIDMVNTLFCNSLGERRLFVALREDGSPAAPKLVNAIECSERHPVTGEAEIKYSNKPDLSHWPCALGYSVWPIEKPRLRQSEVRIPLH